MPEPKTESCFNCKYYQPSVKQSKVCCKRFPPTIAVRNFLFVSMIKGYFPITFPGEWCGEWHARGE